MPENHRIVHIYTLTHYVTTSNMEFSNFSASSLFLQIVSFLYSFSFVHSRQNVRALKNTDPPLPQTWFLWYFSQQQEFKNIDTWNWDMFNQSTNIFFYSLRRWGFHDFFLFLSFSTVVRKPLILPYCAHISVRKRAVIKAVLKVSYMNIIHTYAVQGGNESSLISPSFFVVSQTENI